jgi:hypothetical protein
MSSILARTAVMMDCRRGLIRNAQSQSDDNAVARSISTTYSTLRGIVDITILLTNSSELAELAKTMYVVTPRTDSSRYCRKGDEFRRYGMSAPRANGQIPYAGGQTLQ